MARTQVRQVALHQTGLYDDAVVINESNFETTPVSVEADLNNIRSLLKSVVGGGNWFNDKTGNSLNTVSTNLSTLEAKTIICGVQVLADITLGSGQATGVLTFGPNPLNTETVTIDGKVYTFQTSLTDADGNVFIGALATDSLDNLIAAINLGAGSGSLYAASTTGHSTVTAAAGAGDTMDVTAQNAGTAGNGITTTHAVTGAGFGDVTLLGGLAALQATLVEATTAPTDTAAISTGVGAVVAVLAGDIGTAILDEIAGNNALAPKNLVKVRNATTKDAITSGGYEVYGLLQAESGVVQGDTFDDTTKQVQISFVRNDGSDALELVPSGDLGSLVVEYMYPLRTTLLALNDDCAWPPTFTDQTASIDVTLDNAIDNQGANSTSQTSDTVIGLTTAGVNWRWEDSQQSALFTVEENEALATSLVQLGPAVDDFNVNAAASTFANGARFDDGGTAIDVGRTAGEIRVGGAATIINSTGNMTIGSDQGAVILDASDGTGTSVEFVDDYKSASTFLSALRLADSSAEWDAFELAFGEVSILEAITQSNGGSLTRVTGVGVMNDVVVADTNIVAGGTLTGTLASQTGVTFIGDYQVYVNGQLMRSDDSASGANDYDVYPGTTPANGDLKFEFQLEIGDVVVTEAFA